MLRAILQLIIFLLPQVVLCQSFVFCPDISPIHKKGFENAEIYFVIKDSREFEKKVKEKCNKDEIFNEFLGFIQRSYPKMQMNILDENQFDNKPQTGFVTIKIKFLQYEATYVPGVYKGKTKFEVSIIDKRKDRDTSFSQTVSGESKESNMRGYESGKLALNRSFKDAYNGFLSVLDNLADSFNENDKNPNSGGQQYVKSKADRLKELKQMLDDKILTQEEFDTEKKKILDEK